MPDNSNKKLVIFTRYPEPGTTKTRLIPVLGTEGAADLQRRMTEHVASTAKKLMAAQPFSIEFHYQGGDEQMMQEWLGRHFTYQPQSNGDIGSRMQSALGNAFQNGATETVIIGCDIPGITTDILTSAFKKLGSNDFVFGPAKDGGYYLIGVKSNIFPRAGSLIFKDVDWDTGKVLAQTLEIVKKHHFSCSLLDTLEDVDRPEDLAVWERFTRSEENPLISIIIPTLNEARNITKTLAAISRTARTEVIVVDGGSTDDTVALAESLGARVMKNISSKAGQMNTGANAAIGEVLLFLHADTLLPANFENRIAESLHAHGFSAGAFQLRIDSNARGLRLVELIANLRSRYLQMPYGDQAIFLSRTAFNNIGGFPDLPIMEDFELIRRLRRRGKIVMVPESVLTSPRRWMNMGILRTWLINQFIITAYYLGISPNRLAGWYRREKGVLSSERE